MNCFPFSNKRMEGNKACCPVWKRNLWTELQFSPHKTAVFSRMNCSFVRRKFYETAGFVIHSLSLKSKRVLPSWRTLGWFE